MGHIGHVALGAFIPSLAAGPARRSLHNRQRAGAGSPTVQPPDHSTVEQSPNAPPQPSKFPWSTLCQLPGLLERSSHKSDHLVNAGRPPPTGQTLSLSQASGSANLKQPIGYVPQNRHRPCTCALAHTALVLPAAHIPPIMRPILDGRPVAPSLFQQLLCAALIVVKTGRIIAQLTGLLPIAQTLFDCLPPAPHHHKLPAPAQTSFFRTDRHPPNGPLHQPPVFLVPT